jgi:thiosulfate dehydrogenase [quinone] large subunit
MTNAVITHKGEVVQDPPIFQKLFNHPLAAWIWLPIRVWLGWQWIAASLHKFESPAWMQTGAALKGFWAGAIAIPATGNPPIHYAWYRAFLQMLLDTNAYTWFAKLVPVGEFLVGAALILGLFTGFAAFMGGLMNWNFMMAGSASVNPMFFAISVGLVLAWKIAGWIGADRFVVPYIGALWGNKKKEKVITSPAGLPRGAEAR